MRSFLWVTKVTIVSFFLMASFSRAGEIGIFLQHEDSCHVLSGSSISFCDKDMLIHPDDIIQTTRKPQELCIQWRFRGASQWEQVAEGQYRVVVDVAEKQSSWFDIAADLLSFKRNSAHASTMAASRGVGKIYALPEDGATLLAGEFVTFFWCRGAGGKLVVKDAAGHQRSQFSLPVNAQSAKLAVDALHLVPGQPCFWEVVGESRAKGRIVLLSPQEARPVVDVLRGIEEHLPGNTVEQGLQQAAFLDFITENYAPRYSLRWLQHQLLISLPSDLPDRDNLVVRNLEQTIPLCSCTQ